MPLLIPLLFALVLALARGGSVRGIAALPLRGSGFLLAALAVQIALYLPGVRTAPLIAHSGGRLYVASLALALVGAARNWGLGVAARVATLGLALNTLVIVANGGYMPVSAAAMRVAQGVHRVHEIANRAIFNNTHLATSATPLRALSDVIPVWLPGGVGNVCSIGDALLAIGIAALSYRAMTTDRRRVDRDDDAERRPRRGRDHADHSDPRRD